MESMIILECKKRCRRRCWINRLACEAKSVKNVKHHVKQPLKMLFKEVLLQHMLQHVIPGKNSSSLPFKDAFIQDRPTNATSSRNPAGSKYEHCQWFRLLAKTAADLGDEYEKALKHVRNTHGCNFARRMCRSLKQMFKSVEEEDTCVRHLTTQP